MKTLFTRGAVAVAVLAAGVTAAWTPEYAWNDPAANTPSASAKPGGGGIYGTGSAHDGRVKCTDCHQRNSANPNPNTPLGLGLVFSPALGAGNKYAPGTRYTITATMMNEHFFEPDGGSLQNGFAATFEDAQGNLAGVLESDSGQIQTNCPATLPTLPPAGTTLLYGDCHGILPRAAARSFSAWTFFWTAPAASTGNVTLYWGMTDGNGNDRSISQDGGPDDDTKTGTMVLIP